MIENRIDFRGHIAFTGDTHQALGTYGPKENSSIGCKVQPAMKHYAFADDFCIALAERV